MKEEHIAEPFLVVAGGKELLEFVLIVLGVIIHWTVGTEGKTLALVLGEEIEEGVEPQPKREQAGSS
jgi:hypothetical protein